MLLGCPACLHFLATVIRVNHGPLLSSACLLSFNLLLQLLLARAPLGLQRLVERLLVHVLGPPLAPARQEDLLRVLGEVVPDERA